MERKKLDRMVRLFKWHFIALHEPLYLTAPNRKGYLNHYKKQLLRFLLPVQEDAYLQDLVTLYNEGFYMNEPLPETLKKIETRRVEWRNQQWGGIEYNQPYIPVDDLVDEEGEQPVIRFLAQCFAAEYFLKLIKELEAALDRDGIGQQEELALIRRAKEGKPLREATKPMKEGFRWKGKGSSQKADALYHRLYKRGFLDRETAAEQFVALFCGKPVEKPVRWLGTAAQLVYLVECLALADQLELPPGSYRTPEPGRNEIADENAYGSWLYAHIENCFVDSEQNPFSGKRLKHVKSALRNKSKSKKPQRGEELEKIIKEIRSDPDKV